MSDEQGTLTREVMETALGQRGLDADRVSAICQTLRGHEVTFLRASGATIRPTSRPANPSALGLLVDPTAEPLVFEGELGRGGMGVVRLATQTAMGRKVAVKTLRPAITGDGAAVSLVQEAWITGAIEHPNIVPVYDVRVDDTGRPLVVLKRIDGTAWRTLIDDPAAVRARFGVEDPFEWHLRTLMQVATALHSAHRRGVIHRDVKPDNVMVGDQGEIYVVDWGIAVALDGTGDDRLPHAAEAEGMAGTPAYMAPEMFEGDGRKLGAFTDVYLLGATLYHLLAGSAPHHAASALAMMLRALDGPQPLPEAPPELWAVCARAMAPEPADRFPGADAFRQALQTYRDHRHALHLADEARERLAVLSAGLADGSLDALDRQRLFGECRFGFTRALAEWPGNEAAQADRVQATRMMVEQALRDGQADAAAALLAELDEPPEDLTAAVARARAETEAERARLDALERMRANLDPRTGGRVRSLLFAAVSILWMTPTALRALTDEHRPSYGQTFFELTCTFTIFVLLAIAVRRHLWTTVLNKRIVGMIVVAFLAQITGSVGAWQAGLPIEIRPLLSLHVASAIAAVLALTVDLRLMGAALLFGAAFLAGAAWPAVLDLAIVTSVLGLAGSVWWVWVRRPR